MQKQMQLTTDVNNSPLAALAESVYSVYPKKVGRGAALKAIEKAILKVERVEKCQEGDAAAFLRSKAEEYARARESADPKYTPHAATWFNQERYLDDPAEWSPKSNSRVREQNERPETINVPIV